MISNKCFFFFIFFHIYIKIRLDIYSLVIEKPGTKLFLKHRTKEVFVRVKYWQRCVEHTGETIP